VLWENINNGNKVISNVEIFDRFEIRIFTSNCGRQFFVVAAKRLR